MQKKSYRILEEICGSKSTGCQTFISKNLSDLQNTLLSSLSTSSPSSKAVSIVYLTEINDVGFCEELFVMKEKLSNFV